MNELPNYHNIHEQSKILRKDGKDAGIPADILVASEPEERKTFKIKDYGGLSGAKARVEADRVQHESSDYVIDRGAITKELGKEAATTLVNFEKSYDDFAKLSLRYSQEIRSSIGNPAKIELKKALLEAFKSALEVQRLELDALHEQHPHLSRVRDLISYREDLFKDGHIAEVPSVKGYLQKIEEAMVEGKPMFLHGPTGTGKTSLAIRTARTLTGSDPEMVYCNPQTKESNIFGKTGIGIDEETKQQVTSFDPAPLIRAMKEGRVVIFDEFTALPKDMMSMLKGIMSAKVGDRRTVTGDGEITVAPGFQMIFTANLKSEKNPERQDIPPEMANEFAQNNLEIRYQSADESFDIMLARLLNQDGSLDMSSHDVEVTLPKLCVVLTEIQKAYTDKIEGDMGEQVSLKKIVFNQRTVENIFSRWRTAQLRGTEGDFVSFLDEQLRIPLTFAEYSVKDRTLVAKILARNGFLSTLEPEELGLPADTFSFNAEVGNDTVRKSTKVVHLTLDEVAHLDPFTIRNAKEKKEIADLLGENVSTDATVPVVEKKPVPANLSKAQKIAEMINQFKTKAELDTSIEGGIIEVQINPNLAEKVDSSSKNAGIAFELSDSGSESVIYGKLSGYPIEYGDTLGLRYRHRGTFSFESIVVKHDLQDQKTVDLLLSQMDAQGYRPINVNELVLLAIEKPDLARGSDILSSLDITKTGFSFLAKETINFIGGGGPSQVRTVGAAELGNFFLPGSGNHFLFVPK